MFSETRPVAFLSLCFAEEPGEYSYLLYFDSSDLVKGKQVDMYVVNSGSFMSGQGHVLRRKVSPNYVG
jgi:hypothetical protein